MVVVRSVLGSDEGLGTRPLSFPLPAGHRFPLAKYSRLRARLAGEGTVTPEEVMASRPATWAELGLVHDHEYLRRVRQGQLSLREQREIGRAHV